MTYGLASFSNMLHMPLALLGLGIVVVLLRGSRKLMSSSRELPVSNPSANNVNRRIWTWFWLNFVLEIVLLNIAINLLSQPSQRIYWIPAISFVVGLHFLPMAWFFAVPSYWACGAAMMTVAAGTAAMLGLEKGSLTGFVAIEAVINALILWSTVAWGLRTMTLSRDSDRQSETAATAV